MHSNQLHIQAIKTIILTSTFSVLFACNILAQNQTETTTPDIKVLKQQLHRTSSDSSRARLTSQISTAYRLIVENDSCKKYASFAIDLTEDILTKTETPILISKYEMIRAKAIENFGAALAFENTIKAIDTLQTSLYLWEETGHKPGIAMAYFSLAQAYSYKGSQIEAIDYFTKSLTLFEETKNKEYEAHSLYNISLEKRYLGIYGDALEYSIKSLKVAQEIKDTLLITDALLGNSFNYMLTKNFPEALEEQKKALKLFEITKDSSGIARTYNDMGVTDFFAGKLDNALKHHKKALEMRKKLNDARDICSSYNYVALVYRQQGKLKEALASVKEGLPYALQFEDSRFIMDAYFETGDIYTELKDYDNALANYNMANEIAKKSSSQNYQALALMLIGKANKNLGNINEAITSLQMAENIVLPTEYQTRQFIYDKMIATYINKNDYKNGYEYLLKFQQMSDSINATEKTEKITALTQQLIYENKRALQKASQDKQIALKESQITKQKQIRNLSIAGLLLGIIFAFVFFIRFKEKRKLNIELNKTLLDLKATQKQLIQSEKMASLGELTAGIAHEIQNPLNFVNNFSEVSKELLEEMLEGLKTGNTEEVKELANDIIQNLEKINQHGKRADSIVKGMLQHSRKNSGEKEATDVNVLVDEYLRLAYHGLRAKDKSFNANLESSYDDSIGKINIVPQDIGRVALNLITNAFYASNEKKKELEKGPSGLNGFLPTVSVSTKKENNQIEIEVSDNGNGIPKNIIDKIFQPFFTTKPTGQGTGLGLSLSYDIIQAHGGTLEVNSKAGKGTTFTINIPINN